MGTAMRYQPQGLARLDRSNPLVSGAQAIISAAHPANLVSQRTLVSSGALSRSFSQVGKAIQFRKNFYAETESLPAIGTQSFVEFWYGYPPSDQGNQGNGAADPTFLTGSSANNIAIVASIGATRGSSNWGALYNWGNGAATQFNNAGEVLTPGVLALLVVVRRQTGMEFWHNGRLVASVSQTPANIVATTMIAGAFVEAAFWTSSSDMAMTGRILGEWSADQVKQFSANPWQIFTAGSGSSAYQAAIASASGTSTPVGAALTGAAAAITAAYGALTTSILLAGAALAPAAGGGALTTAIPIASVARAPTAGSAALATSVRLAGSSAAPATASAGLTTSIALTGGAIVSTSATASLAGSTTGLSGSATVTAAGSGVLSTSLKLSGNTAVRTSASAALSTTIPLMGAAPTKASGMAALSTGIALSGTMVTATRATGVLSTAPPSTQGQAIDISKVSPARIVTFDGSGSRVVIFEATGNRIRINDMSVKVPTKIGSKWTVDRDPDEESYYAADIADELTDRNTTIASGEGAITLILQGVTQLEDLDVQVVTVAGVQRTYIVVLLGGVDGALPADWLWTARVRCANGERFDKTTWFNRVDT